MNKYLVLCALVLTGCGSDPQTTYETVVGEQGPAGPRGAPGPTGATGATGAAGASAPLLAVSTTAADNTQCPKGGSIYKHYLDANNNGSLDAGETVQSESMVCNGLDGAKGDTGERGSDGARGSDGVRGEKGEQGDRGSDGARGSDGTKGDKGDRGDNGSNGADGDKGEKGDRGESGNSVHANAGADNSVGKDGDSLIDILTATLYKKVQGVWEQVISLVGPKGDVGERGSDGKDGDNGKDGNNGLNGVDGRNGADGARGADGAQGAQGLKGDKGDAGPQGAAGPKGDTGPAGKDGASGSTVASSHRAATVAECANGGDALEVWVDVNDNGTYEVGTDKGFRTILSCDGKSAETQVFLCHIPNNVTSKRHSLYAPQSAVSQHLSHGDYTGECL